MIGFGQKNWKRLSYGWRKMVRARATPHEIALGCAAGVFTAFTPFLGLQFLIAIAIAFLLRGNIPAAIAGTFVGNPLSWPAIWGASYFTGAWVLGQGTASAAEILEGGAEALSKTLKAEPGAVIDTAVVNLTPIMHPMTVGGVLIGLLVAAATYYPTYQAVRVYQNRQSL